MKINGKTKVTGIFGFPVEHSLSPAMHNAAFVRLGLDYVYVPFEVAPGAVGKAVNSIKSLGLAGVNVTIPHKESVIAFLDSLDQFAKSIGSVNTIVNSNGKLKGYNTDAPGFLAALRGLGFKPKGKTALLFGAGGAGKAVAAALSKAGAKKILITDIAGRKAIALSRKTPKAEFLGFKGWEKALCRADILINATPSGMRPGAPPVKAGSLRKGIFVYDLVYNRPTELQKECKKAGARYSNGLGMLLNQGAAAFELFTGRRAPVETMRRALYKQLAAR